ncbi:hypothetical protein DQ04_00091300 [Trypanosoma grayi]|uniref:hypothetical protein n=1 Tax=Trypanosoma grayi TaxID=71804 RepID=UPI0004F44087|nr:hypothetical protein DQ04_00091300 [Trypanosoma grayi]KEG15396.1 hypothetical protein DQ04_00091300 [Trypanosoma grayi]
MAEGATTGALAELIVDEDAIHKSLIPDDVVIRDYLSCINDDTWVRHAELVNLSDLQETEHEEAVKEEVLRTYIDERRRSRADVPRDLIMEGILWQERFMEEYKRDQRSQDRTEATSYKQSLMESFRTKRTDPHITGGAAAETKAIEYSKRQSNPAAVHPTDGKQQEEICNQVPSVYTPNVRPEPADDAAPPAAEEEYPAEASAVPPDQPEREEPKTDEYPCEEVTPVVPQDNLQEATAVPKEEEHPAEDTKPAVPPDELRNDSAPPDGDEYPVDKTSPSVVQAQGENAQEEYPADEKTAHGGDDALAMEGAAPATGDADATNEY